VAQTVIDIMSSHSSVNFTNFHILWQQKIVSQIVDYIWCVLSMEQRCSTCHGIFYSSKIKCKAAECKCEKLLFDYIRHILQSCWHYFWGTLKVSLLFYSPFTSMVMKVYIVSLILKKSSGTLSVVNVTYLTECNFTSRQWTLKRAHDEE
jgi:hypothetical protein